MASVKQLTAGPANVSLKFIVDHPTLKESQRPLDSAHVESLLASIKKSGLDTPLLVWNGGDEEGLVTIKGATQPASWLIAGNHRRAALRKFFKEDPEAFTAKFPDGVPVTVIPGKDADTNATLAEAVATQLRENLLRKDTTLAEALNGVKYLLETAKLKQKQVALLVGKSEAWVSSVLDIEAQLGEEGSEAVKEGKLTMREGLEAAKTVKNEKKAGKTPDVKATLAKATKKRADIKAAGKERADKRISAKTLHARYNNLPSMGVGKKVGILEAALDYLAGVEDSEVPTELSAETGD